MILETERLTVREFTPGDAEFILALLNDPAFIANIADKGVRTIEAARDYLIAGPIASYARFGFGLWRVALKSNDWPIGMCGLIQRDGLDDVDIGYAFLPEFRTRGYALEVASAVRDCARSRFHLKRLVAVVKADNERSVRLLQKLGMRFERRVRLSPNDVELDLMGTSI